MCLKLPAARVRYFHGATESWYFAAPCLQGGGLVVVLFGGSQRTVTQDRGRDLNVGGILDGDRGGHAIPEQVWGNWAAQGSFSVTYNPFSDRLIGQASTATSYPKVIVLGDRPFLVLEQARADFGHVMAE